MKMMSFGGKVWSFYRSLVLPGLNSPCISGTAFYKIVMTESAMMM